ncbi:MAG: hypothetical protein OEW19_07480, partial [Acidobacteriota bacterium]|nr:hypothetical protein [Acidobacteriota bacterium]
KADPQMLAIAFAAPLMMWRQMHAIDAGQALVRNPRTFARRHVEQFLRGAAVTPVRAVPPPRTSGRRARTGAVRRPISQPTT